MQKQHRRLSPVAVLSAALLVACHGGDPRERVTIGAGGGFVRTNGVALEVPPGALAGDVDIWIERIDVPAGYRASGGRAFRFQPDGLRFAVPLTVRFVVNADERDATVYWSRRDGPGALDLVSTRVEGDAVVASIDHFSIGMAGWRVGEGSDGGSADAALHDAAGVDGGIDADVAEVSGVTCVVQERRSCMALPATTYEDVPFAFQATGASDYGVVQALSSPLEAFNTFYASTFPVPFLAADETGSRYRVGDPLEANVTRLGLVLDVDVDIARYGSGCVDVDPAVPLIAIRCTGTTQLEPPVCRWFDPTGIPALSCDVTRRDGACAETTASETPRFWLAAGVQGPQSELRSDSAILASVFGSGGETRFYQEAPCDTYVLDVQRSNLGGIQRVDDEVFVQWLEGSSSATCTDGLGRRQPLVHVNCGGRTTLVPPP